MSKRIKLIGYLFSAILIFLIIKIGWIKIIYGKEYEAAVVSQTMVDKTVPSERGTIYDANGNILAESTPVYDVILEPRILAEAEDEDLENTFTCLSEITGISIDELNSYMEKNDDGTLKYDTYYLPILKEISAQTAKEIEEKKLVGVWLEQKESRVYPYGVSACHIVGFENGNSSFGIENSYNSYLTGKDGRTVRQYEKGSSEVIYYPPENGCSVISTIDVNIQKIAEEGVKEAMEEFPCETASILVMEPDTGKISREIAGSGIFSYLSGKISNDGTE